MFDKYLDYMQVKPYKVLCFWQKMVTKFWQSADAILEDISVTETIVWC